MSRNTHPGAGECLSRHRWKLFEGGREGNHTKDDPSLASHTQSVTHRIASNIQRGSVPEHSRFASGYIFSDRHFFALMRIHHGLSKEHDDRKHAQCENSDGNDIFKDWKVLPRIDSLHVASYLGNHCTPLWYVLPHMFAITLPIRKRRVSCWYC